MNSKQKIIRPLLLVTASLTLTAAVGKAATFEENEAVYSLCQGTSVMVGKVITAVRDEPRLDAFCANSTWEHCMDGGDSCHDSAHNIQLQVKVLEVLGAPTHDEIKPPPYANSHSVAEKIRAGDIINLKTQLYNSVCLVDPGGNYRQELSALGMLSLNPPVKGPTPVQSVTPEIVRNLYVGRQFVFSVYAVRMVMDDPVSDGVIQSDPPRTYTASIWPLERRSWAVRSLRETRGKDCSGPFSVE